MPVNINVINICPLGCHCVNITPQTAKCFQQMLQRRCLQGVEESRCSTRRKDSVPLEMKRVYCLNDPNLDRYLKQTSAFWSHKEGIYHNGFEKGRTVTFVRGHWSLFCHDSTSIEWSDVNYLIRDFFFFFALDAQLAVSSLNKFRVFTEVSSGGQRVF